MITPWRAAAGCRPSWSHRWDTHTISPVESGTYGVRSSQKDGRRSSECSIKWRPWWRHLSNLLSFNEIHPTIWKLIRLVEYDTRRNTWLDFFTVVGSRNYVSWRYCVWFRKNVRIESNWQFVMQSPWWRH